MQRTYDAIIIGDSLAARIAAVLLARGGCRVLSIEEGTPTSPAWISSSHHLEKLLEALGGRSCLTPSSPFQILGDQARIDFSARRPLDEELRRELPGDDQTLRTLFTTLLERGQQLEQTLFDAGGAPLKGLGGGLKFRWKALRDGLRLGASRQKLTNHLERLGLSSSARTLVASLFSGLALVPATQLSLAEAALLWSSHTREHGVSAAGLDTLLRQRFEQFHGQLQPLESVKHFEMTAQQIRQVTFKNGSSCSADHYLLASAVQLPLLAPALQTTGLKLPAPPPRTLTTELHGKPSPLLSRRIILAGEPPLRLSFGKRDEQLLCAIDLPAGVPLPSPGQLQERLTELLPFCSFAVETLPEAAPAPSGKVRRTLFGQQQTVRLLRNTYLCHAPSILPSLGGCGDALLGTSLATTLLSRRPQK